MVDKDKYSRECEAWYVEGGVRFSVMESVALEVPASIYFDGRFAGEVSCTPQDLEDLAYGYLFSSGVIATSEAVSRVVVEERETGVDIEVIASEGSSARLHDFSALRSIKEKSIKPIAIHEASNVLLTVQSMHRETGATHAAVFADGEGRYLYLREDIGRHNAVDKLVGALLRHKQDPLDGFIHLSSRCALELVEKCSRYGIRLVSTVSAPTSSVLSFAEQEGITICAFARKDHFTVYTHPENLDWSR